MMETSEKDEDAVLNTHHFRVAEAIANHHPLKVDLHLRAGIVFMDVVRNGRNVLPSVGLCRDRRKKCDFR